MLTSNSAGGNSGIFFILLAVCSPWYSVNFLGKVKCSVPVLTSISAGGNSGIFLLLAVCR